MKKKTFSPILLLYAFLFALAQNTLAQEVERGLRVWTITDDLGWKVPAVIDTAIINFQNTTTDLPHGLVNAHTGNLGSPLQTQIFFNRREKSDFLFLRPYSSHFVSVEDYKFFNTRTPYTNLTYYRAGSGINREERFRGLFAVNVNPRLNFGFLYDFIYGRGVYAQQSTNHVTAGLFGSYSGERYEAHFIASLNNFRNRESGGITDDRFITNPDLVGHFPPSSMPVNLPPGTTSQLNNRFVFYNHRYHIGFERVNPNDTARTDFIPVTTFTHTMKLETNARGYWNGDTTSFYLVTDTLKSDTARFTSFRNTFAISLNEGFHRFAQFGLTAFITHDIRQFHFMRDAIFQSTTENNTSIGGIMSRQRGRIFRYKIRGEASVLGQRIGEFDLSANASTRFPFWGDTLTLGVNSFVRNKTPNFFIQHYESTHFTWETNFRNENRTHIGGRIEMPARRFSLGLGVENISNLIYFGLDAMPAQYTGNVQVLGLDLKQNFRFGPFHLENKVIYQLSSNQNVLPLPQLSLYHNLFFKTRLFDVLSVQLGVDLRYNTAFYAPLYMPATGQFHTQNIRKIGNYPFMNLYANFHLTRMRFFFMYSHLNHNISRPNYFSMVSYPLNPAMLKIGLSWNFYD